MSLPQIAQLEFTDAELQEATGERETRLYKTFKWDFEIGDFVLRDGKVTTLTELDYLSVWIQKVLRTRRNTLIYRNTNYGSDHYTLIGQNFTQDFAQAELERMITEALLENTAITGVSGFEYTQEGSKLSVHFVVSSIFGTTQEEVIV